MNAIYKYRLDWRGEQTVRVPGFRQVLSVQVQQDAIVAYALVDAFQDEELDLERTMTAIDFAVVPTGQLFAPEDPSVAYLGTVQRASGFIGHVFYRTVVAAR